MNRLAMVAVLVPDYDQGIRFFSETLGLELVTDEDQGRKRWVVMQGDGGARVLLARAEGDQRATIGHQFGGRVGLFLETGDIARQRQQMEAVGVVFEEPTRHEPYGSVAVFRDPWGNRWDLIEPKTKAPSS